VRRQDQTRFAVARVLESRYRGLDARGIGNDSILQRYIEIDADEGAFVDEVELVDGFHAERFASRQSTVNSREKYA